MDAVTRWRTCAREFLALKDRVAQDSKAFKDDLVSYERLADSFGDVDLSALHAALEARKEKQFGDVAILRNLEYDLKEALAACRAVMRQYLEAFRELSNAINEPGVGEVDEFVVEMSKLLYEDTAVEDRVLYDSHQLRPDPPICGVYKNDHRRPLDEHHTSVIPLAANRPRMDETHVSLVCA